jgi:hypothetical protein
MVEAAKLVVEEVPFWAAVVVFEAVVFAGVPPKRLLVAAGAAVVEAPDVAVVDAGAAVVPAAVEPPNRLLVAGAVVAAGADVAGVEPKRLEVGAAAVVADDPAADEAAAPPKRLLVVLLPDMAAANGLGAAVLAGVAALVVAVCVAGFAPNKLDVVPEAVVAGCDVAAELAPNRLLGVEEAAVSGFLAALAKREDVVVAGAAAGVPELAFAKRLPVDG